MTVDRQRGRQDQNASTVADRRYRDARLVEVEQAIDTSDAFALPSLCGRVRTNRGGVCLKKKSLAKK